VTCTTATQILSHFAHTEYHAMHITHVTVVRAATQPCINQGESGGKTMQGISTGLVAIILLR
jgi:hypothetical protein